MKCSKNVSKIVEVWKDACIKNSGNSDMWCSGSREYIWEQSKKEYPDGAIAGTIFRRYEHCIKPTNSFRVDGDGMVVRAPNFLRKASCRLEMDMALEAMSLKGRNNNEH